MLPLLKCLFGPRLYKLYRRGERQGYDYEANILEYYSDVLVKTVLISLPVAWSLGVYSSPLIASFMYRKGYFTSEGIIGLFRFSGTLGILFFITVFIRGIGRMMNNDYLTFLCVLNAYKQNITPTLKQEVSCYDFDFREWPADYYFNESFSEKSNKIYIEKQTLRRSGMLDYFKGLPCGVASYIAMHTFGRMMIYPGSVGLLNAILAPMLLKGRTKLVEDHKGERFKLVTKEGNEIDSLFIDRRNQSNFPNGNVLVICCEGNSGFYEYGITLTPIDAGYSVLGWNHPGFGSSTGVPYPDQELNAIDVVMQFALNKLGFKIESIVIYAWSIGGFSATWAAMNYPDIKGLVLDATFDDLVALAVTKMPPSWKSLVVRTIREYMNLNIAEQLCKYSGPVLLIRRTRDEIISTRASAAIQTNRGNDLLMKLLSARYPKLVTDDTSWALKEWLSGDKNHQNVLWAQEGVENELCETTLVSYVRENSNEFPYSIGEDLLANVRIQLLLYLADKYMLDFDSTHCTPLPTSLFHLPWNVITQLPYNDTHSHMKSRM